MGSQNLITPESSLLQACRLGAWRSMSALVALIVLCMSPMVGVADPCEVPDNGGGTVNLPPDGCQYLSPDEVHVIIDGLPPGTTITFDPIHDRFFNVDQNPGGNLGGEVETFDSFLEFDVQGTGDLAGFARTLSVMVTCEVHTGPRNPGDPVQDFANDMFRLEGAIFGDPDFDLLIIRAGTDFGLPSPGNTTLTQLPTGDWNVDSFFDIEYQIEFQGAPGSVLDGMGGITQATLRMGAGDTVPPPTGACCLEFGDCIETTFDACPSGDFRVFEPCDPNPCPQPPDPCVVPDNGNGTVHLPPEGCQYLSPQEVHMIIDGLPPGTTITFDPIHDRFFQIDRQPGGTLGGEVETFNSFLQMDVQGTGDLAGFQRTLTMNLGCEVHTGPRNPGDPVQTFGNDMFMLQGAIFGDPDFDQLIITAGTNFGLPSPGQTTLTQLPTGDFNVDSFFDIEYRIEFQGAPGSILDGLGGTTQATVLMSSGQPVPPPPGACCYPDGTCEETTFDNCQTGDFRAYEHCDPNPCPQQDNHCFEPDNGNGTVNLPPENCAYLSPDDVHLIIDGLPPGTTIELDPIHHEFINIDRVPGGPLGGEIETFDSALRLEIQGTGDLEGFQRLITVPIACEVHTGPRTPGEPVQSFPTDMFRLQGEIFGDPDFDQLRITAGTGNGLPSPGHTILLDQEGRGDWAVDSFFDISYEIEFVGAPGSVLDGLGGTTMGTIWMGVGFLNIPQDVDEPAPVLRGQIKAHPNPFFNTTTISFDLEAAGLVELQIFDVSGRMVRSLANKSLSAGTHQLIWDGRDGEGTALRSGVYFYQLRVDGRTSGSKRTMLLK